MSDESKPTKKRATAESLGWLTESSIMPRKQRLIDGVGASSIVDLKAQLYKSQEDSKRQTKEPIRSSDQQFDVHRAKKIVYHDAFSNKNSGVEARAAKDKLEFKAVRDGSASYAALERKAKLYDKLVKGELPDEEDQEKYCVDFFRKGVEQETSQIPIYDVTAAELEVGDKDGNDGEDFLVNDSKAPGLGRAGGTVDRSEHKRFVMEVHEEANEAREKVSELKIRRQEQAAARREKLKQAYLKKQLEKLKASKAAQT